MSEVVIVIGAGSIGQAIARRVSAGKHVVLADLRDQNGNRRTPGPAQSVTRHLTASQMTTIATVIASAIGKLITMVQSGCASMKTNHPGRAPGNSNCSSAAVTGFDDESPPTAFCSNLRSPSDHNAALSENRARRSFL